MNLELLLAVVAVVLFLLAAFAIKGANWMAWGLVFLAAAHAWTHLGITVR